MAKVLEEQEAKDFIKSLRKKRHQVHTEHKGTKGYYRVAPRNYTAFRVNGYGILRIYESIQHEGDCRKRLKLPPL